MKDKIELIRDYNECIERINNFYNYDVIELSNWANTKYLKWINKDINNAILIIPGKIKPRSLEEKSYNELNNLKIIFEKIALKK